MTILLDQKIKKELINTKRSLCLPYLAHQILNESLEKVKNAVFSRNWTLPETKFTDEVEHYSDRHKNFNLKGARPKIREIISEELAEEFSLKINSGLDFLDLAKSSDPQIKPILIYYSCIQLCGVLTRAFFEWEHDKRVHGINCSHSPKNLIKTKISIENKGQFPRLATTLFLLSGYPSCFSELVTYSKKPSAHTEKGGHLDKFGAIEIGEPVRELYLPNLLNFDFDLNMDKVKNRHGFHKFTGYPTTAFLIDVATLFSGSSFARYNIMGWKDILEGKDNPYRLSFEKAYDRYSQFAADIIISVLADPFRRVDKPLYPSKESPYSERNSSVF